MHRKRNWTRPTRSRLNNGRQMQEYQCLIETINTNKHSKSFCFFHSDRLDDQKISLTYSIFMAARAKSQFARRRTAALPSLPDPDDDEDPFRIPSDNEIMALSNELKRERTAYRQRMQHTAQYLRGTAIPRATFRKLTEIPPIQGRPEEEALAQLILSPDSSEAREGLRDFVDQKREIFLAQLSIETKKEELQRLERLEKEEELKLAKQEAEINLFREQFQAFLENDGKTTTEARHAAEEKSKQRLEVALKIKQVSSNSSTLRSEIAHFEEKLQECERYKEFLEGLTPPEWRKTHPLPEMYFKEPSQLIDVMQALEEQNMFLIQHCQDAEEMLERFKGVFTDLLSQRDGSIIDMVNKRKESEAQLEETKERNAMYTVTGEFRHGNEFPPNEKEELIAAIKEFHTELGYESTTRNPLIMLRRIENKLETLTAALNQQDRDVVAKMFVEKVHKRIEKERAETAARKQKEQEEKFMRAFQLATMPIKRQTGRPLLPRSLPEKADSREKREEQMRILAEQKLADKNLLYGPIWD